MKQLTVCLVLSTAAALSSCAGSSDGGSCPESPATTITGLGQSAFLSQADTQRDDDLVQYEFFDPSASVQADGLMLAVVANAQFVALENKQPTSLLASVVSFFVRDATALSCIAPQFVSEQVLNDITITSDAAVSELYPAGSNLAEIFRVGKQAISSPESSAPIGTIVARAPGNRETIPEYLSAKPQVPLLLAMTLNVADPITSQHVFTITYTIEGGTMYTTQTAPVSITP